MVGMRYREVSLTLTVLSGIFDLFIYTFAKINNMTEPNIFTPIPCIPGADRTRGRDAYPLEGEPRDVIAYGVNLMISLYEKGVADGLFIPFGGEPTFQMINDCLSTTCQTLEHPSRPIDTHPAFASMYYF